MNSSLPRRSLDLRSAGSFVSRSLLVGLLASLGSSCSLAASPSSLQAWLESFLSSCSLDSVARRLWSSFPFRLRPAPSPHAFIGRFAATCYWRVDEREEGAGPRTTRIRVIGGSAGPVRLLVSKGFKQRLDVEGSAILRDSRVLNVTSRKGVYSDTTVSAPSGQGAKGQNLVPYRSIAINSSKKPRGLAHGDRVFIPQAVGLELPFGLSHDGFFIVNDVGSGVRGIDLYAFTRNSAQRWRETLRLDSRCLSLYRVGGTTMASSR